MSRFDQQYELWMHTNILNERNPRRLEILHKGLDHGTVEFLRSVWFPTIGNLMTCIRNGKYAISAMVIVIWTLPICPVMREEGSKSKATGRMLVIWT